MKDHPESTVKQKVISEIMSGVERVRFDTERNFLDVLDRVHQISHDDVDPTHVFALSQVYEELLLRMGEKNNDGGQFFTPREVIRAMVKLIDSKVGETVYDPGCGTGGFLAEAYEPSSKPSANCWTNASSGASSACRRASSPRRAPESRPICCSSPKAGRPSGSDIAS